MKLSKATKNLNDRLISVLNKLTLQAKPSKKQYQKKLNNMLLKQGILLKGPKQNLKFGVKED